MDPLDKLEMILTSTIKKKKRDLASGLKEGFHPAEIYAVGVQKKIDAYEECLAFLRQIKRNSYDTSDEIVLKMYGDRDALEWLQK